MPAPVVFLAVAAAAAAIGLSAAFSADARTRRALKKQKVSSVREAGPDAVVRVRGRVVANGDVLAAPLSDRSCVYFLATVEQQSGTNNNRRWREVAREERFVDFVLDDGSGKIVVCMSVPRVAVVRDLHTRSGTFDDANEREEAFLARHGLRSTNFLGLNSAIRYIEGVLEIGEEVTVLGKVRVEVRNGQRTLVLDALDDGPLLLSDDPRAVHAP